MRIFRTDPYRADAFQPWTAMGIATVRAADGSVAITGTTFRFGHARVALTARHCVTSDVAMVASFIDGSAYRVESVIEHPSADIAAMLLSGSDHHDDARVAFQELGSNVSLGQDFMSFGFPIEGPTFDVPPGTPTPRVFVGHFQRFFNYTSPAGYAYHAAELSIAAPAGYSGAPLFSSFAPATVTGIVTSNVESYAIADSITTIEEDGSTYREEARRVLSYGIALILSDVAEWLRAAVPWREWAGIEPPRSLVSRRSTGPIG
jgi:hypothetical protein